MSGGSETALSTNPPPASTGRYLIRLTLSPEDRDEMWDLCREVEHLGGIPTDDGYVFASRQWRDIAAEYLADGWGPWYFVSVDDADRFNPRRRTDPAVRLLIAASDAGLRDQLCRTLTQHGFDVEPAADALQCLDVLRLQRPQLLVLDRQLLWGGGDGVLARLRDDLAELSVPVLLLLGPDDPLPHLQAPLAGCLHQPLSAEQLVETLQRELLRMGSPC